MELAASGFNAAGISGFGFGIDRGRSEDAGRPQSIPRRPATDNTPSGRIIPGEVVDRQTEVVYPNPDKGQQPQSSSTQAEKRRVSPQQAIQMFQQNEAIPTDNTQSRQVSGIIDIYV